MVTIVLIWMLAQMNAPWWTFLLVMLALAVKTLFYAALMDKK